MKSLKKTEKHAKQSGSPSRRSLVLFRVTRQEKTTIETRAKKRGLTVSQLLRNLTLGLIVCIARSEGETHWTGDVFGHVSEGYSWIDPAREAMLACGEMCEVFCFDSRE